ncbi:hypothetical protein [Deinococcus sp.]|uniref:hypothetical protein n=1 Tax=Deinococcus sp. TaxID=47478 RepID=UPI003CC5781E
MSDPSNRSRRRKPLDQAAPPVPPELEQVVIAAAPPGPEQIVIAPVPSALPEPPPNPQTEPVDEGEGHDSLLVIPELTVMFPGSTPFLARFLPQVPPSFMGLNASFCNLHDFLRHLHDLGWYGYLHAFIGDQAAFVLVFEGRTVAAASVSSTGEQALGELLHLYEQGAPLSAYALPATLAHILSGVGSRAWKFNLTEDFTGLHARPTGAIFYARGEIVATMPATLPYEGAFPAPLRPQTLILPRSLAGWAHGQYNLTLRGRDALNAITSVHQNFRAQHGSLGLAFLRALADPLTPAEYAMRSDVALHDLEPLLQEFLKSGIIKEQMAG